MKTPLQQSLVWQTFNYNNLICFYILLHTVDIIHVPGSIENWSFYANLANVCLLCMPAFPLHSNLCLPQ